MYADRRRAFQARIRELLADYLKSIAAKRFPNPDGLSARIQSALEDAYQMGLSEGRKLGRMIEDVEGDPDRVEVTPLIRLETEKEPE